MMVLVLCFFKSLVHCSNSRSFLLRAFFASVYGLKKFSAYSVSPYRKFKEKITTPISLQFKLLYLKEGEIHATKCEGKN